MSTTTAACLRCGIRRAVKPERGVPELCGDCQAVEQYLSARGPWQGIGRPPLAREHGTERGYQQHRHQRDGACGPCRQAHAAHDRERRKAVA